MIPPKYAPQMGRPGNKPSVPLEPCPFCGSKRLYVGWVWVHALGVAVVCGECRARTRSFELPAYSAKRNIRLRLVAKAADAWNQRNPAHDPGPRSRGTTKGHEMTTSRDGDECYYCGKAWRLCHPNEACPRR